MAGQSFTTRLEPISPKILDPFLSPEGVVLVQNNTVCWLNDWLNKWLNQSSTSRRLKKFLSQPNLNLKNG